MNPSKLDMVKHEMARNIKKSEYRHFRNQWTKMDGNGWLNSDDHYIYYCGQESLRRNEVALRVNKRVENAELGCNLKTNRIICLFRRQPLNITVIQVYAPTTNAKKAEWFYEDLHHLLELTHTHTKCLLHHRGLECKSTILY